jgi:hypothetical protein
VLNHTVAHHMPIDVRPRVSSKHVAVKDASIDPNLITQEDLTVRRLAGRRSPAMQPRAGPHRAASARLRQMIPTGPCRRALPLRPPGWMRERSACSTGSGA